MKRMLRKAAGLMIAVPFWVPIRLTSLFAGKRRAIEFWGPLVSRAVTAVAEFFLIPKIGSPDEFGAFKKRIIRNARRLKLLYDISIQHEDEDTIVFNYRNCPHCEAFSSLGLPEINPYICSGDWDIARRNSELWDFERAHQIGTGDGFCDHTYVRKNTRRRSGERRART